MNREEAIQVLERLLAEVTAKLNEMEEDVA